MLTRFTGMRFISQGMLLCLYNITVSVCAFALLLWLEVSTQWRQSVGFSCLNKVCACSQLSALLHLTPLLVRTSLTDVKQRGTEFEDRP
jgi:hypothetical protein